MELVAKVEPAASAARAEQRAPAVLRAVVERRAWAVPATEEAMWVGRAPTARRVAATRAAAKPATATRAAVTLEPLALRVEPMVTAATSTAAARAASKRHSMVHRAPRSW